MSKTIRYYESTVFVNPEFRADKVADRLKEMLTRNGAKVTEVSDVSHKTTILTITDNNKMEPYQEFNIFTICYKTFKKGLDKKVAEFVRHCEPSVINIMSIEINKELITKNHPEYMREHFGE